MNNKIYTTGLVALLGGLMMSLSSCQDKIDGPEWQKGNIAPAAISNPSFTSTPGEIVIKWDSEEATKSKDLFYVKATYFDPYTNENVRVLGSGYADSVVMHDTFRAAGAYTVTLTPVSTTGAEGTPISVDVLSEPVESSVTMLQPDTYEQIPLTAANASTNAQEPTEGPIAALFDNNVNTYFHTIWSGSISEPHYLQIDLDEPVDAIQISFNARKHDNTDQGVKRADMYGKNEAGEYVKLFSEEYSKVGSGEKVDGSGHYLGGKSYSSFRFVPTARYNADPINNGWFNMSEFRLFKAKYRIVDWEALAKAKIENNAK